MDADFSDTDYMLFEETADAGPTGDEVIHNILSVCRKPATAVFDKITDEGIISSAYDKYDEDVLLDQPGSPPMNLLDFESSATMDLPEENTESIRFGDNVSFANLLATTEIGEIEEDYIHSVSGGGDFLDTEDDDLTLFKELGDDNELCCPSDRSVSSTCLESIAENFEDDTWNESNDLEQTTEADKNCRVHFFKMSSLKDNRRTRNGLQDYTAISNTQIQTELNSDYLDKRYVFLIDTSEDETIVDNRSPITFTEFDPSVVAQDETEVFCQNNDQEFSTSYDFHFGEGKEIPPSEGINLDPSNIDAESFVLDCNQNLNETGTIPVPEIERADKIKGCTEELQCANETIILINNELENTTEQIEEESVSNNKEGLPDDLKLLESEEIANNCADDFDCNRQNLSKSGTELHSPEEDAERNGSSMENSHEQTGIDGDKHDSEVVGDNMVDDLHIVEVSQKPEIIEETLRTDSEAIRREEMTGTNSDEDSSVSKLQEIPQEERIEKKTSEPVVDESSTNLEPVQIEQQSEDKIERILKETGDKSVNESTEPLETNTEVKSDYENRGSKVDALQFMLLREMWRNKGLNQRQPNTVESDLEQNEVFIALLKEFLMNKNCDKYIPQLTGIDIFIKERNIQSAIKTKKANIKSQKETSPRQNNKSPEEPSLDESPAIIINECYIQATELHVPCLETEKVVEAIAKSLNREEKTSLNESPIPKNNSEIAKRNGKHQIEEILLPRKELKRPDTAKPVLEPNKTADLNSEGKNLVGDEETDKTSEEDITKDKSTDDACSPVSNCYPRNNELLTSNMEKAKNDTTINYGQCSSKICDSTEILRLKYLKDISFQPFVKLEVLNLRDHLVHVKREKYGQENRRSHRRICPRIITQPKHVENIEGELPTSGNGKNSALESCTENSTIRTDTIENIILPESPKSIKTPPAITLRKSVRQSENKKIYKTDVIKPKGKYASNPKIAQTAIREKINSTNTLIPRLERIDTLLDLPIKLSESLRSLKIIYEIGRKLTPTINDIYKNEATEHQHKLSTSQKYHIRRHRRKPSNKDVEKIIPEIPHNYLGAEEDIQDTVVPVKAGDENDNLKEKEIADVGSKELKSERLIGSNLPKLRDKQTIETTKTVGKTMNKDKIRIVRFSKINAPIRRKRGRPPKRQDSHKFTCEEAHKKETKNVSEVVVNQESDNIGPIRRRTSTPRVKNLIQRNSTTHKLLLEKTGRTDNMQLKKLKLSDHEEEINDSVLQRTGNTSGSEVNQRSDDIPLIERKRPTRQDSIGEELENEESTCTSTCETVSERTSETIVHQPSDPVVASRRKPGQPGARTLIRGNTENKRLISNRRTRSTDSMKLRKPNNVDNEGRLLDPAVPTTSGSEVDQHADEISVIKKTERRQTRQNAISKELKNEEFPCGINLKEVSEESAKTEDSDYSEVQIAQTTLGSAIAQSPDVPIKRKRGKAPVENLIQKKPRTDELLFESRRMIDPTELKKLTVVLNHKELIDDLLSRTTEDTPGFVLNKHSAKNVPVKRKKGRARCQASTKEKLEDVKSACTNTEHQESTNDSDLQPDVPLKRKRDAPRNRSLVEQRTKPSEVSLRKLRSTKAVQLENSSCLSDQSGESNDQTKKPKKDENDHLQNPPDSSATEPPDERLAKTSAKNSKPFNSKKKFKSNHEKNGNGKTIDSAITKENKADLPAEDTPSDRQNDKQVVEIGKESSEAVETPSEENTVGTIQKARNDLQNELYKLYFTKFFIANGHIVRFQYVSGRLAVLDAKIANVDQAESFVKAFAQFDCANYLLWKDFDRERYILRRTWLCETNGHQSPDVLYKSLSCQARIHISIKQPSSSDYNGHVLIYMEHTHNSMSKEKLVNISK